MSSGRNLIKPQLCKLYIITFTSRYLLSLTWSYCQNISLFYEVIGEKKHSNYLDLLATENEFSKEGLDIVLRNLKVKKQGVSVEPT